MDVVDGRRIYVTNTDQHYPSITTILHHTMTEDKKNILNDWIERVGEAEAEKIKNDAADRGTILHNIMEKYLFGMDYESDLKSNSALIQRLFKQFKGVLDKNVDNIRLLEKPLYSKYLKIAGRVDMISEYNGKLSIIDFKTSTRVKTIDMIGDYLLQETFYSLAYAEHFGEKIEQIVTIIGTEKSLKPYVFTDTPQKHLTNLVNRVNLYYKENSNEKEI